MISIYSRALHVLARERDLTDTVARELALFGRAIRQTPELEALWLRVRLPWLQKTGILRALLPAGFSSLTRHFLLVLVRRRRESYLWLILTRFKELVRRDRGRVGVRVASFAPLAAPLRARLRDLARRMAGAPVDVEYRVEPALRGGFVLRAGDYMLDASLRGRLERLEQVLAAGAEVTGHGTPG